MPPISNAEILITLQGMQKQLGIVETKQNELKEDLLRLDSEADKKDGEYVTKNELHLQLENIRLTIEILKTNVQTLSQRLEGLEARIVSEIKEITKKQQEEQIVSMEKQQKEQLARMRGTIAIQSAVLFIILSAFVGAFFTLILPALQHLPK